MNNEYKYYEFDPGQAVVFLLNETIGKSKLMAVSYFLAPNRHTPDMYAFTKGRFKKLANNKPYDLPNRELPNVNYIEIVKTNKIPKAVQNILNPQKTLYGHGANANDVLQLCFVNMKDKKWDFVYILIDKNLQESIKLHFNSKLLNDSISKANQVNELLLQYFSITHPMLNEFVGIEYKKYHFFDEITSTLERTIKSKNRLAEEIKDLKLAHKSGLENEIVKILQEKSATDGPRVVLSKNAQEYVMSYQGEENILLRAIDEAAELVIKMYALNRTPNLEIDLNYIQIHLDSNDLQANEPAKKKKEKARLYLDKYEEAASVALRFKNKVNIKYIADYTLPRAVRPPAVSANISKYKDEIRYLLLSYPQKWKVLRTNFGPIAELSNNEN